MWNKGLIIVTFLLSIVVCGFFLTQNCEGTPTVPRCAIIIVSDHEGYDDDELKKADQFYQYLMDEGYNDNEVYYLTESSRVGQDQEPTITNIQSAFSWLNDTSRQTSQPVIYISDHVTWISGNVTLQFSDGNISTCTIDSLIDPVEYNELTSLSEK